MERHRAVDLAVQHGIHRRWGRLDVTPDGIARPMKSVRYQLVIYPPGTTTTEARLSHLATYMASPVGLFGALLVSGAVAYFADPIVGLGVLAAIGVVAAIAAGLTSAVRGKSARIIRRTRPEDGPGPALRSLVGELFELDNTPTDPVAYELAWGRIYDKVRDGER